MERNGMKKYKKVFDEQKGKLSDIIPAENIEAYLRIYHKMRKTFGYNRNSRSRHKKSSEIPLFDFDLIAKKQKEINDLFKTGYLSKETVRTINELVWVESINTHKGYKKTMILNLFHARGVPKDLPYDFLIYALVYDAKLYTGHVDQNIIELEDSIHQGLATPMGRAYLEQCRSALDIPLPFPEAIGLIAKEMKNSSRPEIPLRYVFDKISELLIENKILADDIDTVNDPSAAIAKSYERLKRQYGAEKMKAIFYTLINLKKLSFLSNIKFGFVKDILYESGLISDS